MFREHAARKIDGVIFHAAVYQKTLSISFDRRKGRRSIKQRPLANAAKRERPLRSNGNKVNLAHAVRYLCGRHNCLTVRRSGTCSYLQRDRSSRWTFTPLDLRSLTLFSHSSSLVHILDSDKACDVLGSTTMAAFPTTTRSSSNSSSKIIILLVSMLCLSRLVMGSSRQDHQNKQEVSCRGNYLHIHSQIRFAPMPTN